MPKHDGPAPVLPVVHMNGTSGRELLELRENVYAAINEAISALARMAPNGRDYYPVPGLMERALAQHGERMRALGAVLASIEAETIALGELIDG